jgi:aminoglycoside phosphotransferase (APT) family kinase protein
MKKLETVTTETARAVFAHHFGKEPKKLQQIHGGVTNFVFEASIGNEDLILRISNRPTKLQFFMKEQWAVRAAHAKNVPTPEILEVGNDIIGMPYMVMRRVEGEPATARPIDLDIYRQMGAQAKAINSIATSDFGHIFDWSRNRLSRFHSWKDYMTGNFQAAERLETLARHKMLRPANLKKLKTGARKLPDLKAQPTLNHGDLRLKNVMLNGKGKISAIIDWEQATSNWAPYWELAISLHDLGIDEKESFLDGYGIAPKEFEKMSGTIKLLNILHYGPIVEKAAKAKDRGALARFEQRLNAALDLFSV